MKYYLGLDMGTTGVKAAVFDRSGTMLGSGLAEYTLETPTPDIVELDAEIYWISAKDAIKQAVGKAKIDPADIRSLSVTGQAETLIMVDKDGVPLRKAVVWLDNRAAEEAAMLNEKFGSEYLFRLSGQTEMLPCWPAPKILWYQKHQKELFDRTAKYLMVEDFIVFKLTGLYATCSGLMPSALYYDIRTDEYDPAMLEAINISIDQLPELKKSGELIGQCVANDSLIAPGPLVAAAPIDHVCGNLGSGCAGSGIISETTGCTLALCAAFDKIVYDEEKRLSTYLGFAPGSYVLLPWAPTAGMLLKHFRDEFTSGMDFKALMPPPPPFPRAVKDLFCCRIAPERFLLTVIPMPAAWHGVSPSPTKKAIGHVPSWNRSPICCATMWKHCVPWVRKSMRSVHLAELPRASSGFRSKLMCLICL